MRILVLQLCRLGDILQTTPMLRGLRNIHPDAEIVIVPHEAFAHVPVPGALYDRWHPFPAATIGSRLATEPSSWRRQVAAVREFVDALGAEPFDLTLNLTHSDLSGLLAAAIPSREVRGGLVAPDRTRVVQGDWMTYFWSSQTCRELGCFNLVDIHNWTAGVPADGLPLEIDVGEAAERRVESWLVDQGLADRPVIAVQLGASDERKRWPPERFADAVSRVPPELGTIVLVGARAERPLAERFKARARRSVHDAVGVTTIPELAALLGRCRLLATNDTGTMHVAAATGTRVVDVSTGPVFVHETGPYGDQHLVIEPAIDCFPCTAGCSCSHIACRDWIDPRDVGALLAHALGAGQLPRPERARILRGSFLPSGRLDYGVISPAGPAAAEAVRQALATVWERTLPIPPSTRLPRRGRTPPPTTLDGAGGSDRSGELGSLTARVEALATLARAVPQATVERRNELAAGITAGLQALQLQAELVPAAKPFLAFLKVGLDSVTENAVENVSARYERELLDAARRLRMLADVLREPMPRSA